MWGNHKNYRMKLTNLAIQKFFTVKHKSKTYYVDYLASDGPICGLFNRFNWEILDEELEELGIYEFKGMSKKEKKEVDENVKLYNKLVNFCIKHFNDFKPNYKEDC